jgi:hypothetical protein
LAHGQTHEMPYYHSLLAGKHLNDFCAIARITPLFSPHGRASPTMPGAMPVSMRSGG